MFNFETRRRAREKMRSSAPTVEEQARRSWLNVLVGVTAVAVLVLGYAFVQRMFITPPVNALVEREDDMVRRGARIQVNVVNSSGVQHAARHAMDYLRARGFDVVEIGNAPALREHSEVIDRVNDSLSARKVAFAVGIADSCVRLEVDRKLFLDVTLIIGEDYLLLKPWK